MKTKICSLASVVSDSRCPSVNPSHVPLGHGTIDTAEVIPVNQVRIAIFAESKHKLRRVRAGHIDHRGADTDKTSVAVVEREPVGTRPVVGRLTGPSRPSLQADNCFAT